MYNGYTEEELLEMQYNGRVFKSDFFIGWIDRLPYEQRIGEPIFFMSEEEWYRFTDECKQNRGYDGVFPEEGQWFGVHCGEYPVEGGRINWDLGIRKSSHILYDCSN